MQKNGKLEKKNKNISYVKHTEAFVIYQQQQQQKYYKKKKTKPKKKKKIFLGENYNFIAKNNKKKTEKKSQKNIRKNDSEYVKKQNKFYYIKLK